MAEFNSEMYLRQQTPDILGGIQSGLKIGEMKRQRKAADTAEMFKKGLREAATTDANGNVTYDQKRLSALGGMFPQEVSEMQAQNKASAFEQKKREQEMLMKHQEYAAPIVLSMSDPQSYQQGLQKLKAAGNPMAQELPPEFDPKLMAAYHRQVTPVAQHFAMKKEQADMESRGFTQDGSGKWVAAKGGSADLSNREKAAQIAKLNAERDYIAAGKPGGRGAGGGGGMMAGQGGGGIRLSPDKVLKVQEGDSVAQMLPAIADTIKANEGSFGPFMGRAMSMNPYNEKSQTIDSQMRASSQAFGKYMEGGVLRKEDEDKYRKMFPNLSDTPEVAQNKLAIVQKLLVDKQSGDLNALKTAGYNTAPFQKRESPALPNVLGTNNKATAPAAPHPQDNEAVQWAKQNAKDPRAAAILKANGA